VIFPFLSGLPVVGQGIYWLESLRASATKASASSSIVLKAVTRRMIERSGAGQS